MTGGLCVFCPGGLAKPRPVILTLYRVDVHIGGKRILHETILFQNDGSTIISLYVFAFNIAVRYDVHVTVFCCIAIRVLYEKQMFYMLGNRKYSDGAKSGEFGIWSTSSKPQSRTAAIATTHLCAWALSWWNRTPIVSFPGHSRHVSNLLLFKVLKYLSSVGLSGRQQCS